MANPDLSNLAAPLLAWYDRFARDLPWRVSPAEGKAGRRADPYRVWLSEIMLQQTTVSAVRGYFSRFLDLWPSVEALAAAEDQAVMAEWAGLGYYARARNLLACARQVAKLGGFPANRAGLLGLPGIGPYSAAAISAIAFGQPEVVVDGNVERVCARLLRLPESGAALKARVGRELGDAVPFERPGDFAQAMMDLGATICTPRGPSRAICPLSAHCQARAAGEMALYPRRAPKPVKPIRRGHAYVLVTPAGFLVEQRPAKGLLGGMVGFPTGAFGEVALHAPPCAATWRMIGEVRHTFTHFHLILTVHRAAPTAARLGDLAGHYFALPSRAALPSLMRKVHDLAAASQ